jgi:threonine dehydrogenase-like Zn-dependent dehydrogenase
VEEREDPRIIEPTDAILRLSATCVCGSDLWPYRGVEAVQGPSPMGHEYVGIVQEDDGVARIKELTGGLGAHSVIEGVGTSESMLQAIGSTRPGGHVGFVGVAHGAALPVEGLFWSLVHLHGGPAPVRRFLPELIDLIWNRRIDPGKVFDLSLPLEQAAEGYQAMDQRPGSL